MRRTSVAYQHHHYPLIHNLLITLAFENYKTQNVLISFNWLTFSKRRSDIREHTKQYWLSLPSFQKSVFNLPTTMILLRNFPHLVCLVNIRSHYQEYMLQIHILILNEHVSVHIIMSLWNNCKPFENIICIINWLL